MRNESLVWPEVRMPGQAARGMVEQQITATTVLSFKTRGKKSKTITLTGLSATAQV